MRSERIRLENEALEVEAATDFGPRILHLAARGMPYLLGFAPGARVKTPWGDWRPVGGHRLWLAPEDRPRSYHPDDSPVRVRRTAREAVLTGASEAGTGLQKQMILRLEPRRLEVRHRLLNRGRRPIDASAWALSICRPGSTGIVPREPWLDWGKEVRPAGPIALWHYTDPADPRFSFRREATLVRADAANGSPTKLGFGNFQGWAACRSGSSVFLKSFLFEPGARYPDFGSTTEVYTKGGFLELETLGPIRTLRPGEAAEHIEWWHALEGIRGLPDAIRRCRALASPNRARAAAPRPAPR
ncbi:MAG: hypothetical protein AAB578_01040 [Elusimicrobiota bacterium]